MGLRELLRRFILGVPLGFLLRMPWPVDGERSGRQFQGVVITALATIVFVGIAIGEIFVASGYPDITEVVLGAAGAGFGLQLVQRSPAHMSGK